MALWIVGFSLLAFSFTSASFLLRSSGFSSSTASTSSTSRSNSRFTSLFKAFPSQRRFYPRRGRWGLLRLVEWPDRKLLLDLAKILNSLIKAL
jgi:hypothetical protein